jgi:hypothetical protein
MPNSSSQQGSKLPLPIVDNGLALPYDILDRERGCKRRVVKSPSSFGLGN